MNVIKNTMSKLKSNEITLKFFIFDKKDNVMRGTPK